MEIKIEVLKQMFRDLNLNEKMLFEEWVKKQVSRDLIYREDLNDTSRS